MLFKHFIISNYLTLLKLTLFEIFNKLEIDFIKINHRHILPSYSNPIY